MKDTVLICDNCEKIGYLDSDGFPKDHWITFNFEDKDIESLHYCCIKCFLEDYYPNTILTSKQEGNTLIITSASNDKELYLFG